ncbi:MAG TPA: YqhA family protein [Gemmatimonadales bacterium]|nr:YqhA family protein [Gemmatimonadales bacterium]
MTFEQRFESLLWSSRLVALIAVIGSLAVALAMFYVATMDVLYLLVHLRDYGDLAMAPDARAALRGQTVAHVVEVVDGYLLAAIMLIFSLGLYELFVSRIDVAEGSAFAERLLLIRSLDDLKDRLAKVVLLILVVKFFEYALGLPVTEPIDLLYLAIGIVAVAAALALSNKPKPTGAPSAGRGDGNAG